jgi:hypothetical protein
MAEKEENKSDFVSEATDIITKAHEFAQELEMQILLYDDQKIKLIRFQWKRRRYGILFSRSSIWCRWNRKVNSINDVQLIIL